MIVYQIQSPISTASLQTLIEQSAPEDTFVFMGQATVNLPVISNFQVQAYALNSDLNQLGVNNNTSIQGIDDREWVDLCVQATQVVSWF